MEISKDVSVLRPSERDVFLIDGVPDLIKKVGYLIIDILIKLINSAGEKCIC